MFKFKRITRTSGLNCYEEKERYKVSDTVQTKLEKSYGMRDSQTALWHVPSEQGHYLDIQLLNNNRIVVMWYIYDLEGKPLWLIGIGTHDGHKAHLDVHTITGGKPPPDFSDEDTQKVDWGKFELEFPKCNEGIFKWFPNQGSQYIQGENIIKRLATTLELGCSAIN